MTDRATQRREFTEIVREHGPWVLAWLSRRAPAGVDPDDLAQEIFLALSRGRDRIRKPDRIHAWLFGVAKRILAREIERAKRRRRVEAEGGVVRMSHPPPADLGPLDEAIARLPEDLAAVVTTYYSSEYTYEQTANILGIPRPTFQSRLRRALAMLRSELSKETDAEHAGR